MACAEHDRICCGSQYNVEGVGKVEFGDNSYQYLRVRDFVETGGDYW